MSLTRPHHLSIGVCVWLAACSGGLTVVLDTPTGVTPIYTPSPAAPGGFPPPPPGLDVPAAPVPTSPAERNGNYAGTAVPLNTGGGLCISNQQVGNFRVRGNSVRYGGFRGRIDPEGGLQMVYGQDWIIGQFEGATFHGQLDLNSYFGTQGCTYMLSLARVGP
jgi:hypothetical protein